MFQRLGNLVARGWPVVLGSWCLLAVVLALSSPPWNQVTDHGQRSSLPPDTPSNRAQAFYDTAFPHHRLGSTIVVVLRRQGEPLRQEDKDFIALELEPALDDLLFTEQRAPTANGGERSTPPPAAVIDSIQSLNKKGAGPLFVSRDKQATVVVVELKTQFQNHDSWPTIEAIEGIVAKLRRDGKVPQGLEVSLTGSAYANRDVVLAERQSAADIEIWTVFLVIGLLFVIYRAPLVAIIPLATVFIAVQIAVSVLSLLAGSGLLTISEGLKIYITVLAYGAGVDYCLFLTARYREELDHGEVAKHGVANAIGKVGDALTASAATVIAGIGMMFFSDFDRYRQAGLGIPFALIIVLLCTLTFSAALLRLVGRAAFWPRRFPTHPVQDPHASADGPLGKLWRRDTVSLTWHFVGQALLKRPGAIWLASVLILLPFFAIAVWQYTRWDYGLGGNLPASARSVQGTTAIKEHFTPGMTGPVIVLLHQPKVEFRSAEGRETLGQFVERLKKGAEDLKIADIRSIATPAGITAAAKESEAELAKLNPSTQTELRERAVDHYVSDGGDLDGRVTRLDIVLTVDPLSGRALQHLGRLEEALRAELPPALAGAEVHVLGPTAGLRDLQNVTTRDLRRMEILVPLVVLLILIAVLRDVVVSLYLIVSVLFSYLVTLGMTIVVFWALDPAGFAGLDWKVPILLGTILVAVGEDYNIFLMTRVKEERVRHGPIHGVTAALIKTGGIISSCGVIMAGTFAALLAGSLLELKQLGFALAVGVLLDTMVVRPVLVPAFLIWMARRSSSDAAVVPHGAGAAPLQRHSV
ncbi:MAG: MMPL family transporter [Gemmataceae bacterium]|nr:MMPL family transporter [Gemmataceae bacterium]